MNTNAAQLAAARADVERWTRQLAEAEADQDRLAAVPDDPDTARQIARERGEAHGLAQLCRDGLAAAQAKAATLERDALRASLRADADALAPAIDADQERLTVARFPYRFWCHCGDSCEESHPIDSRCDRAPLTFRTSTRNTSATQEALQVPSPTTSPLR